MPATLRSELITLSTKLSTDRRLLDAAAELIDERGVDDATVGAITERAGQRNGAAVHYHFGGRDGLLDALVARQHDALDEVRAAMLEDLDAADSPNIAQLVRVVVEPLLGCLDTVHGRAFLLIQGDRSTHGVTTAIASSVETVGQRLGMLIPEADEGMRIERTRLIGLLISARLARAAAEQGDHASSSGHLSSALVDAVTAILTTIPRPIPRPTP